MARDFWRKAAKRRRDYIRETDDRQQSASDLALGVPGARNKALDEERYK